MKIYKNPFVSRDCYFVKTGKAYSSKNEETKSEGYQVEFWNGKWEVKKVRYYDFSLRDELPIIAENNVSIQSVIEKAILKEVLDLVHLTEKGGASDG